ncbi:fimbria/pilus periplasmic chaperone [Pantoea ananatis]|uniref:fimbria/pilus periplasmic chaperone n=1 Tax=Pantoea ananas TaxID=553 RepID=UPI0024AC9D45|nr:fimbria/pilus periplasmic chaperone [Pantoea ananatis]MDI6539109.1 fimbria/pilus periplasmic chaperone [Pantoea ananatis]
MKSRLMAGFLAVVALTGVSLQAQAGVALGATRVVYPAGQKQVSLGVTSSDDKNTYLIQSWVEDQNGKKNGQFVITPPLFVMQGKKENTLRIIDATNRSLPQDRESLFWLNVKAIPSVNRSQEKQNVLQLAITSRIKLLYRPTGLKVDPVRAPDMLRFRRGGNTLTLVNPTPYFLTVTELNAGTRILESTMVPPFGESTVKLPADAGADITYRTINDYGALTPKTKGMMQ